MKNVVVVTHNYPTPWQPEAGAFTSAAVGVLKELVETVEVIAPVSALRLAHAHLFGTRHTVADWSSADNFRPAFFHLARAMPWRQFGKKLAQQSYRRIVRRSLMDLETSPDMVYTHFGESGDGALDHCALTRTPLVMNLGESSLGRLAHTLPFDRMVLPGMEHWGIVAVSRRIRDYLRDRLPGEQERILHLPNAVNLQEFKPGDRARNRRELGLPRDEFIALFCGHLNERKGPIRVQEALDLLGGKVKGVFLGQGAQVPKGPNVLHTGVVPHALVPKWLSAADVFVLPSLAEGMSNAVLEAMACGLPAVLSNRDFNREFLDESASRLIDPTNPAEIAAAIGSLCSNPAEYRRYSFASRELAEGYDLHKRMSSVLEFAKQIKSKLDSRTRPHTVGSIRRNPLGCFQY